MLLNFYLLFHLSLNFFNTRLGPKNVYLVAKLLAYVYFSHISYSSKFYTFIKQELKLNI